jgi:TatD DNase family protein
MYVDTHLHLADPQFEADREAVIERARVAGVTTFIEIAESPETWDAAVALAERYPFFYASVGIHPHHAHQLGSTGWPALEARLRELLAHPKVVAIGEFGLDYFRMQNTAAQQDFIFRAQLRLAKDVDKPIIIHCREAHADVQSAIRDFYPETSFSIAAPRPVGVVHCFSGSWADAQTYLMHGFMLGIDGPVTYPSAKMLQENVLRLPLPRIVLETDAPYLPPQTHRGQRNEPHHIPFIAETIATLKRKPTDEVARQTTANARALFRLPTAP